MEKHVPETITEYISLCPTEVQPKLNSLRSTINRAAPNAKEKISWGMATFDYYGNLVHFAAEKKHIGFHPAPSAIVAFEKELNEYSCSKGTVRFLYTQELPLELIEKIVRFRVLEQEKLKEEKDAEKAKKKSCKNAQK